ncbi:MAG: cobalamin B12-binding domain-containing protein [Pseudomonadota bacterium]
MTPKTSKSQTIDPAEYTASSEKLRSLKSSLPQGAVVNLAREVLGRLANQSSGRGDPRVVTLAHALIAQDPMASLDIIEGLQAQGTGIEALYLQFLAPAARHLGEMWQADDLSFADVTLGTARIYGLIRTINPVERAPIAPNQAHALFVCVPGDTHTLGVRMAADLFRRRGWDIELLAGLTHDEVMDRFIASDHWHVGISAGNDLRLTALARLILALRAERPGVRVLVAGHVVGRCPAEIDKMSPDAMAEGFEEAFKAMTRMNNDGG